jgi:AcrR family transcriptional regulator
MAEPISPRRDELIEAAYGYVLEHGLSGVSLRPIAESIGSSTGVLRFLFGSKDGLVQAILGRARQDELTMLADVDPSIGIAEVARRVWAWLREPHNRGLLVLWTESYAASLLDPDGAWGNFARTTVADWLTLLARSQPVELRRTSMGRAQCTAVLAMLRGSFLDLIATGDTARIDRAMRDYLATVPA